MIRRWRATTMALGVAVLARQVGNALNSRLAHLQLSI
jgi:hypothetical protein